MFLSSILIYGLLLQVHSNELRYGDNVFNGVFCAITDGTLLIDTLFGVSLGACKQACFEMRTCLTMHYIRPFYACQLLARGDGTPNQLVITGSCASYRVARTIGLYCTRDSDCVENHSVCLHGNRAAGGLCFCDKFYRYIAARCVKVCDHLLDDFKGHVNNGITHYNSLGIEIITLEECEHKCEMNQECMSYEYLERKSKCQMARVSTEMMLDADPTALGPSSGWTLYSRQCGDLSKGV